MSELWGNLIPLILGSALVPAPFLVTALLVRSSRSAASAWIVGMASVRLIQGAVLGLIYAHGSTAATESPGGRDALLSGVLLAVSLVLLAAAARLILAGDDPDAAPPKWVAMTESMTAGKAFLLGAGYLTVSAKLWVFTLGTISAIGDAALSRRGGIGIYLGFVGLVALPQLVLLCGAMVAPARSQKSLDRFAVWLESRNRVIKIIFSVTFGAWFFVKGLSGLGIF